MISLGKLEKTLGSKLSLVSSFHLPREIGFIFVVGEGMGGGQILSGHCLLSVINSVWRCSLRCFLCYSIRCYIPIFTFWGTFGPKNPLLGLKHMSVVCNFHRLYYLNIDEYTCYRLIYCRLCMVICVISFLSILTPNWGLPISDLKYEICEKIFFFLETR